MTKFRFDRIKLLALIRLRKLKDTARLRDYNNSIVLPIDFVYAELLAEDRARMALRFGRRFMRDRVSVSPGRKQVIVYRGPGYPIDPAREENRKAEKFRSLFA